MNYMLHKTKGKWSKLVVSHFFKVTRNTLLPGTCEKKECTYNWQTFFTTSCSKAILLKSSDISFQFRDNIKCWHYIQLQASSGDCLWLSYRPWEVKLDNTKSNQCSRSCYDVHDNKRPHLAQNLRSVSLSMTSPIFKNTGHVRGCKWSITAAAKPLHK